MASVKFEIDRARWEGVMQGVAKTRDALVRGGLTGDVMEKIISRVEREFLAQEPKAAQDQLALGAPAGGR